ncbi:GAF domain-containing protein [Sphingomonas sp.]|uniref:GAF domain-containing protein n=1 Tax=Sphingomonas sp. TaxID=28214 RepID=UPI003B00CD53
MIGTALSVGVATQPDPVDSILDAVRVHFGVEIAFAARYVGDRRQFTHIRTELPVPHRPGDSEPNEDTYCWHVLQGNLPELIQDAADFPLAQTLPITNALPVGCHMDVPIRLKDGSVYGSFCCLSRAADRSLTGRDLAALHAFAALAAVQIEGDLDRARGRATVIDRIEAAVAGGQPAILLQPVYRLSDGAPVGVEALARFADASERPPSDWF